MTFEPPCWRGLSPTDRAREVALTFREFLIKADPDEAARIDARCAAFGEDWMIPELRILTEDDDTLITAARAAELLGVQVRTVYTWLADNPDLVAAERPRRMRWADVRDEHQRRRRAARPQMP